MKRFEVTTKIPTIEELPDEDSLLSLFDEVNPDLGLFNAVDEEIIRLSGSQVKYYKSYIKDNYDKVYLEEKNKVINQEALTVWCSYDPTVIEEHLSEFGNMLVNDQVFVFNKSYIEEELKREPKPGDVIQPVFQNMKYEVFEVQEDSFEVYGVYHYNCHARILRDSKDVVSEPNLSEFDMLGALGVR